jgi:hypothetical protein
MNKILKLIKANKVVTIMLGVFILGGGVTAILSQCLPSYTVDKVLITEGPEDISGNAQTAGESDAFQYTIEGTAKNGGKAPTPDFTILMTSDQSVPS